MRWGRTLSARYATLCRNFLSFPSIYLLFFLLQLLLLSVFLTLAPFCILSFLYLNLFFSCFENKFIFAHFSAVLYEGDEVGQNALRQMRHLVPELYLLFSFRNHFFYYWYCLGIPLFSVLPRYIFLLSVFLTFAPFCMREMRWGKTLSARCATLCRTSCEM